MLEKHLRVPINAADAKTAYITLTQEIEKLSKFDVYVVNYLFQPVLTCSEISCAKISCGDFISCFMRTPRVQAPELDPRALQYVI